MEGTDFKEFRYRYDNNFEGKEIEEFFSRIYDEILEVVRNINDKNGKKQFKFILEDNNGNDITFEKISELLKDDTFLLFSLGTLYREYFWELNIWEGEDKPFMFDLLLESNFYNSRFLSLFYTATNKFKFKNRTYVDTKFKEVVERLKAEGKSVTLKTEDWLYD